MTKPLLEVKDLKTYFYIEEGVSPAVDGVSFTLNEGETLAIVGESGCGKSVTSLSILRLIASPPGRIVEGEINYKGTDLLKLSERQMRKIRGNDISMIFQEPMTSLNPVFKVGQQISESLTWHQKISKQDAMKKAVEMLGLVGIPDPEKCVNRYPHELSGGMRQRVMIAMALACKPAILIADEPTTALDVTIQAQILRLMQELKRQINMSIILITHDLGIVAQIAQRVMVMYAGQIVEYTDVNSVYSNPCHPYTFGLLGSIPKINETVETLYNIKGTVPNPVAYPPGCRFAPRCEYATVECTASQPELYQNGSGHLVRCFRYKGANAHG